LVVKGKRISVEQIVAVLKKAELGLPVVDAIRHVGISEAAAEAQCCFTIPSDRQQEVHRGAGLVDCAVQVFPCAFDPHIGLI
jgi:hypothetical protein